MRLNLHLTIVLYYMNWCGKKLKKSFCKGIGIYLLFKRLLDNNETHSVRQRGLSSESEII